MTTRLNTTGDTIVEVLLAILVISMVIAGAYVSAARSLQGTRQAEERGQALKLAEGQVEQIKGNVTAAAAATNLFCFASGVATNATNPAQSISSQQPIDIDPLTQYTAGCKNGVIPYNISVARTGDAANGYLFTVYVRWFRIGGSGGKDEVRFLYRIYP